MDHRESKEIPEKPLLLLIDYAKTFDYVDHNKLESSLRDGNARLNLPEKPECGQEATVRIRHGTMDWFTIVKGVQ